MKNRGDSRFPELFLGRATRRVGKHHKRFEEFAQLPTIDGLLALCDSDKRWQNVRRINRMDSNMAALCKELGNFTDEILSPRNHLAHGVGTTDDAGQLVFEFSGKLYAFTEVESISLRKKIAGYRREFEAILIRLDQDTTDKSA